MERLKNFHQQVLSLHNDISKSCKRSGYEGKDGMLLKYPSEDKNYYLEADQAFKRLVLDFTDLKQRDFPAGFTKPQSKIVSLIKDGLEEIRVIVQLSELRTHFSERLADYVQARDKLENEVTKIKGLMESTEHIPPAEISQPIKLKLTELFDKARVSVLNTARYLNALCMFSIDRVPNIQGYYSWFSLYDRKANTIYMRQPWHQYVDPREGKDVEDVLAGVLDMVILSSTSMLIDNTVRIEMYQQVEALLRSDIELKVKAALLVEKVSIMFPLLYNDDMKTAASNNDDDPFSPDFHSSKSSQSEDDLADIVGDFVNKARRDTGQNPARIKIKQPDISIERFFDCCEDNDEDRQGNDVEVEDKKVHFEKPQLGELRPLVRHPSVPLASSQRKQSDWDEESMRSSKIGPGTSIAKLVAYGEKGYRRAKETFEDNTEKQVLHTVRKDIEKIRNKLDDFAVEPEFEIENLQRKLYNLTISVDKKIAECDDLEQRRRMLPKAKLMVWDGDMRTYSDFRKVMSEMLNYGHADLDLETLKQQIVGGDKAKQALDCLFNVKDVTHAFEVLDRSYGNILMLLPQLKKDLDSDLRNLPMTRKEEGKNIQKIMDVIQTLIKHGQKPAVDLSFIQLFRNKLREHNREKVMTRGVKTCDEFAQILNEITAINKELDITDPDTGDRKKYSHHNSSLHGAGDGHPKGFVCKICSGDHFTPLCDKLAKETSYRKREDLVKNKKLCVKCFYTYSKDHTCSSKYQRYVCRDHKKNKRICGCKKYSGPKKPVDGQVDDGTTGGSEAVIVEADIQGAPRVQDNRITINEAMIGGIGHDVEILDFLTFDGRPKKYLVGYDNYCSHTCIDHSLAKDLGYPVEHIGQITMKCLMGLVSVDASKTTSRIKTKDGNIALEFIINDNKQDLPVCHFDAPDSWVKKYNIKKFPKSAAGLSLVILGKDNCHLFPEVLETEPGIQLAKSKLTGEYIISGRAIETENVCNNLHPNDMRMVYTQNKIVTMDSKDITLLADRVTESPLKRCLTCVNCSQCKKELRPDEARQRKQTEIIKENISFHPETGYTVVYPKNSHLKDLPSNSEPVLRMMKQLEVKLKKNVLLDQFNKSLKEFFNTGVIAPVSVEMTDYQASYIPLCYALANNDQASTKLRVCSNSGFKVSSQVPSFNDTCINGPLYLNNMDSILSR